MPEPTRTLIVEDEVLFGELLRHSLSEVPGLDVLGVVRDGPTAVLRARELLPDAILMDVALSGEMDGIEAALQIKKERSEIGIVFLSAHDEPHYVSRLPLGETTGWSYLVKQTLPDIGTLIHAIDASVNGMVTLDPAIVENLHPRRGSVVAQLSPRYRQVLELIAKGYSNAAIARQLALAEKSVETYINAIYQELDITGQPDSHARVKATLAYLDDCRG